MRFASNIKTQLKNSLAMLTLGTGVFAGYCVVSGNAKFYHQVMMPVAHKLISGENSHRLAVHMVNYGIFPRYSNSTYPEMKCKVFGLEFSNPIGMAAGFDKNGECVENMFAMGFSHVEIGSVTPEPQYGNIKPRVFRLKEDESLINRYGFNNHGHMVVYERLKRLNWKGKGILGVNLGVNKTSQNPTEDYTKGMKIFGELADYIVINVSSPNTPGLRKLQKKESLSAMLKEVLKVRNSLNKRPPFLLKISPDETDEDLVDIINVVMSPECRVDGLIVSNTTIAREELSSPDPLTSEAGGLSGKALSDKTTKLIARVSSLTKGSLPIIGVGGVDSGVEAWKKLMAGASLVQLYTSMVYHGPPIVKTVSDGLHQELHSSEYASVGELLKSRTTK